MQSKGVESAGKDNRWGEGLMPVYKGNISNKSTVQLG